MAKQFVVLFMGMSDDIPVAVFADRDLAVGLATAIGEAELVRDKDGGHHHAVEHALRVMSRDMGTFCGTAVAAFTDGVMVGYDCVVEGETD